MRVISERNAPPRGWGRKRRLDSLKRPKAVAFLSIAALVGSVLAGLNVAPKAEAFYGPGGQTSSEYINLINWVDWKSVIPGTVNYNGDPSNSKDGQAGTIDETTVITTNPTVSSVTSIGAAQVTVTCTLSNAKGGVSFHAPGQYAGDAFDDYYDTWLGTMPKSGAVVGIGGSGAGNNSQNNAFDVTCSATLTSGTSSPEPIAISGLVFANAETIDGGEFFNIAPQRVSGSSTPVTWRILENPSPQCDNSLYIGRGTLGDQMGTSNLPDIEMGNAIQMYGPDSNCYEKNDTYGPYASMYAEGATGARIQNHANSGYAANYLAIGVVITADFADGFNEYGEAATLNQPHLVGGTLESLTEKKLSSKSSDLSKSSGAKIDSLTAADLDILTTPRVSGAEDRTVGVDGDFSVWNTDTFNTFVADDESTLAGRVDDDNAVDGSLVVPALAGNTYQLDVACEAADTGTTKLAAWLDWDANLAYDGNERADSDCVSGKATFTWAPSEDQLVPVTPDSRTPKQVGLRIIATSDISTLDSHSAATATYLDGEVEDHPVTLIRPNVQLTKQIVGADGSELPGISASGWSVTATGTTPTSILTSAGVQSSQTQVTPSDGRVVWKLNYDRVHGQTVVNLNDAVVSSETTAQTQFAAQTISLFETFNSQQRTQYRHTPQRSGNARQNITCSVVQQPSDWGSVFAWPSTATPQVTNLTNPTTPGVSLVTDPTSVLDCVIKNQPYGQISVKPELAASAVTSPDIVDPTLKFSGTYTCTAPSTSPFAGTIVKGTWGPISADSTWISDLTTDKIPLGSSCTIAQTTIASEQHAEDADPVQGCFKYGWSAAVYQPSTGEVSADTTQGVAGDGHSIPVLTVTNTVTMTPTATLAFNKVDGSRPNKPLLSGAQFHIESSDGAIKIDVMDADAPAQTPSVFDVNTNGGEFTIENLPVGSYILSETQAPVGYQLRTSPVTFEITNADVNTTKLIDPIENQPILSDALPGIPLSGGLGTISFTAGGVIVLAVAIAVGLAAVARRREPIS